MADHYDVRGCWYRDRGGPSPNTIAEPKQPILPFARPAHDTFLAPPEDPADVDDRVLVSDSNGALFPPRYVSAATVRETPTGVVLAAVPAPESPPKIDRMRLASGERPDED